jgi:GNAT superfamily N-acetyltransferase
MQLEFRALSSETWRAFEKLFGARGACGGCWCMAWRIGKNDKWEDVKGEPAHRRMRALVRQGKALGVLAFDGDEPVGWCTFGPRADFPRLDRARTLACDDADRVWSLPCFFIKRGYRGQGVASALLGHVLGLLQRRGVRLVEAYPAKPPRDGKPLPAAFAWMGPKAMFDAFGFELVGDPAASKQRMRLALRRRGAL